MDAPKRYPMASGSMAKFRHAPNPNLLVLIWFWLR
ncbi:unnamed protein product, partial [Rotaria magnacalcarata]